METEERQQKNSGKLHLVSEIRFFGNSALKEQVNVIHERPPVARRPYQGLQSLQKGLEGPTITPMTPKYSQNPPKIVF